MSGALPPGGSLKIVRLIARLNVGGPARHVLLLERALRARGHQTLLVYGAVGAGEASMERLADDARVRTIRIDALGPRISMTSDMRAFVRLVALIFRERPDVVHTHTAKAGALGRIAALMFNLSRRPRRQSVVVHTFHGHVLEGYFRPSVNVLIRLLERCLAMVTDRIITVSSNQRLDIVERFGITSDEKAVAIPLGLNLEALLQISPDSADCRRELGIRQDDIVLGFVGRMVAIKDLDTLVRAFALALQRVPSLVLVLAGDGPCRADIEKRVQELGVADRVRFLGWVSALPRLYATIDVGVLASLNEGTPVALIETMAAGKPVVATSVGGVPAVVEHEVTGLLAPARAADAIGAAMARLATDPALRARMGATARHRAAHGYSETRLVDQVERLYSFLVARRRAVRRPPSERVEAGARHG